MFMTSSALIKKRRWHKEPSTNTVLVFAKIFTRPGIFPVLKLNYIHHRRR